MQWFRNLKIARKLVIVMTLVSVAAVLLATIGRIAYDWRVFRHQAVRDLTTLAKIIGDNCAAPLEFDDSHAAQTTLNSLAAKTDVAAACVYRKDGSVLARYSQDVSATVSSISSLEARGYRFANHRLILVDRVARKGETLGTVCLVSTLQSHYARRNAGIAIAVGSIIVASLLAIVMAARLHRVFSVPILALAKVADQVSAHRDYSLRANQTAHDEIGKLADVFNHMLHTIQERDSQLRQISVQTLHLQDEERKRIARELHDATGQNLAALSINLAGLFRNACSLTPPDRQLLAQCKGLATQCAEELRTLSYLLHPPLLDECGLASALNAFIAGYQERTGIRAEVEIGTRVTRYPPKVEIAAFRILQEALTNIHRHSGSGTARIRVRDDSNTLTLEIQDFGRGFPQASPPDGTSSRWGVGLSSMRERAAHLGGSLTVETASDGTIVRATLPVKEDLA